MRPARPRVPASRNVADAAGSSARSRPRRLACLIGTTVRVGFLTPASASKPSTSRLSLRNRSSSLRLVGGIRVASLLGYAHPSTERQAAVSPNSCHLAHRRSRRSYPLPDELRRHQPVWRKGQNQGSAEGRNARATRGRTPGGPTTSSGGYGLACRSRWPRLPLQQRHPASTATRAARA